MRKRKGRTLAATLLGIGLLVSPALTAAPAFAAVDLQAENANISNGLVESNHAGFTGSGFVNYDNEVGSFVEFTVASPAAQTVGIQFRFANGTAASRPMDITVNGAVVSDELAFPATGAWSTWSTITINVPLRAIANNTIRATATTAQGGPNLDRLTVDVAGTRPTPPGQPRCSNITDSSLTLAWGASTDPDGIAAYDIYHDGTKLDEVAGTVTTHTLTGLQASFTYRLSVFARDPGGSASDSSPLATCVTLPSNDTQPPTRPGPPSVSNITATSADLTWGASTDPGGGVTAYDIRDNADDRVLHTVSGTPPATRATVPLECGTRYQLHVVARDRARNTSPESVPTSSFTTGACGGRGTPQAPTVINGGWDVPWDLSFLPDRSAALITERDTFRVYRVATGGGGRTQVGTVPQSQTTDGEGGLMGIAVSPTWNGTSDQQVFFFHTSSNGNRIARMNYNGSTLTGYTPILGGDAGTLIRKSRFHNGGRLRFGPDGFLYAATGDSQQPNLAPDLGSLNGKILRITTTGAAAPGNPAGRRFISSGHRNPQGLAWDSAGRLWSAEFGNSTFDEVNLITPGANYGWPECEGDTQLMANLQPFNPRRPCNIGGLVNAKWQRPPAQCSCAGMAIVNNTIYLGALRGMRLWRIELNGVNVGASSAFFTNQFGRIRAVEKIPGQNAIWFTTSNSDNNGNGQPDNVRRSNIS